MSDHNYPTFSPSKVLERKSKSNVQCSVYGCGNRSNFGLYKLPPESDVRRQKWITVLRMAKVTKHCMVCGQHFNENDFIPSCNSKSKGKLRRLKKTAVPSRHLPMSSVYKSLSTAQKAAAKARRIRFARRSLMMAESYQKITDTHTDFSNVNDLECSSPDADESANVRCVENKLEICDTGLEIQAMNSADLANMCLRELIYTSQLPIIFSESLDWDILKWNLEEWSKVFRDRLFQFRCATKKCQKSPMWESQCETEYHTFEELIKFSKNETPIKNRWWYFDYKPISDNFADRGYIFETVSWKGLGFPEKGADDSTIWIGSPGAHTPCHFDSYGCNIVAQIFGKKRWILFPPSETDNLKPTRVPYEESSVYSSINFSCSQQLKRNLQFNKCYVVDMNAGDVLLIPPKWWHYVENTTLAISVNMWIPVKDDDISRLDEALVRYLISSLTCNASVDTKNLILNPNELDLKGGSINLQIIEFCRKTIEIASDEISIAKTKTDLYNLADHSHKYKVIKPISIFELNRILPDCLNSHNAAEELQLEDPVDTLSSVINAFCHPDIICRIRDKFLN